MGINDSNKTDGFDNEQSQLVHNDVAYQAATETTLTNGNQKTQLTDGTNTVWIQADTASVGALGLVVRPLPWEPSTYSTGVAFTAAATPTDVFNIIGSATKTIRITKIRITGTTTSGSAISTNVSVIRRSALNTGGTRVVAVLAKHDTVDPTPTASAGHYTANPTALGASAGTIRSQRTSFTTGGVSGGDIVFEFPTTPITLRGATEQLVVNMGSTTITGNVLNISVEWQEI